MATTNIDSLLGKTFAKVERISDKEIIFTQDNGDRVRMYHSQCCCEYVYIEDINGELEWLIGTPILQATEKTNNDNPKSEWDQSHTWTFYTIRTKKGTVDIRWYGSSSGHYSESVDFEAIEA